jgi:hypothetical protein
VVVVLVSAGLSEAQEGSKITAAAQANVARISFFIDWLSSQSISPESLNADVLKRFPASEGGRLNDALLSNLSSMTPELPWNSRSLSSSCSSQSDD